MRSLLLSLLLAGGLLPTGPAEAQTTQPMLQRAACQATDRSGLVMVVDFTGNGQPVIAARPGQDVPSARHWRPVEDARQAPPDRRPPLR